MTVNSIPASAIVAVTPSVISAGGSALDLNGLFLTTNTRVPIGTVASFPTALAVANFFGATTQEAMDASVYFLGFDNSNKKPGAVLFSQYPEDDVRAYLRSGRVSGLTLAELQALTGVLIITINGTPITSGTINLAAATSFSNAAQLITTGLGTTGPTEAVSTGSIGASVTGSITTTVLTVSAVSSGVLAVGQVISGVGVTAGTTITSLGSGTGGTGTYNLSASQTVGSEAITSTSTTMVISAVASGTLAIGQEVTGSGVTAGTFITALVTGTGGTGTYTVSAAQHVVSETLTMVTPTVTYDSTSGAFVVISPTAGDASTIGFGSGTIAADLLMTSATGAVLSQGADATDPTTAMDAVIDLTQNWAGFTTCFDPDDSGNDNKLLFAAWTNAQNNRYFYAMWDTDITPTESTAATASAGYLIRAADYSGTVAIYEPTDLHLAAFVLGSIAALDFQETNGRATMAFRSQSGLAVSVTSQVAADNLMANGYNFYGRYATANDQFTFFYDGAISGDFAWIDSYVNQIQLNNALQLAMMTLLTVVKSIPYNPPGYALIEAAAADPINAALNYGSIRPGVTLSAAQIAEVNFAAGAIVDRVLSTRGWYFQVKDAAPIVRAARGSPPCTLWYMDGQSVQRINLASVEIQ